MDEIQNEDGSWSKAEPIKASFEKRKIKLTVTPVAVDIGFAIGLILGLIVHWIAYVLN